MWGKDKLFPLFSFHGLNPQNGAAEMDGSSTSLHLGSVYCEAGATGTLIVIAVANHNEILFICNEILLIPKQIVNDIS